MARSEEAKYTNEQKETHGSALYQCGAVSETSLDDIMPYLEQAAREQHFELEDYSLNLMGLCWRCKNENGSQ